MLVVVFLFYLVMSLFENIVDERLRLVYTIFNILLAFILTRRSTKNPGKRVYESILFSFLHDKDGVQHNIEAEKRGEIEYEEY